MYKWYSLECVHFFHIFYVQKQRSELLYTVKLFGLKTFFFYNYIHMSQGKKKLLKYIGFVCLSITMHVTKFRSRLDRLKL